MSARSRKLGYLTMCAYLEDEDLPAHAQMIDDATDVTWRTFRRNVDTAWLDRWQKEHGYGRDIGLTLGTDWHVSFHRSKWKGRRCYYFVWSGFEIIFCNLS